MKLTQAILITLLIMFLLNPIGHGLLALSKHLRRVGEYLE